MKIREIAIGAAGAAAVFVILASPQVHAVSAAVLVNVMNTAANPVPTRQADITNSFAVRLFPTSNSPATFTVPAGKYLVVTSVNGFSFGGTAPDVELDGVVNGAYAGIRFPFNRPNSSANSYLQNTNTQYVIDPGTTAYLYLGSNDNGGYNIDIKGYFLPAN